MRVVYNSYRNITIWRHWHFILQFVVKIENHWIFYITAFTHRHCYISAVNTKFIIIFMFQAMWFCIDVASVTVLTVIGATFQDYILPYLELEESTKSKLELNCAMLLEIDGLATFLPYMACAVLFLCGSMIIFFTVSAFSAAKPCLD